MGKTKILSHDKIEDSKHAVYQLKGVRSYRREPCARCPWKLSACGEFPAEAFRLTAKAGALENEVPYVFFCHASGPVKPAICAGWILGASETDAWKEGVATNRFDPSEVIDGGAELYGCYHEMAVANGVSEDDPVLVGLKKP